MKHRGIRPPEVGLIIELKNMLSHSGQWFGWVGGSYRYIVPVGTKAKAEGILNFEF